MSDHLAWHETLEIHELVAFQSNGLQKLKKSLTEIRDQELKRLYGNAIRGISTNLKQLLEFYHDMPMAKIRDDEDDLRTDDLGRDNYNHMTPFYAGDLLGLAKASVRNYSVAITETATPELRRVIKKQLNNSIELHEDIFQFMYMRGYYPAYDLEQLLANDLKLAQRALSLREE